MILKCKRSFLASMLVALLFAATPAMGARVGSVVEVNGHYAVSVNANGQWSDCGLVHATKFFRDLQLEIPVAASDGRLRVRIQQEGGGLAHIDAVTLDGTPSMHVAGADFAKLAAIDNDVADATRAELEFVFSVDELFGSTALLILNARVEPTEIPKRPFVFPASNPRGHIDEHGQFYRYRLGSVPGKLNMDGELNEELGEPFFADYLPVGSGHPQGSTYGWVRDDGKNLYVTIDFTSDNTVDDGADYAKVHVNTAKGLLTFTTAEDETKWGAQGFTYTDRVSYQHMVYEFAIPLSELGTIEQSTINLAFETYGTSAEEYQDHLVVYDSVHNTYIVLYSTFFNSSDSVIDGVLYDHTGTLIPDSDFSVATGLSGVSLHDLAFDPVNSRAFAIWNNHNSGEDKREIRGSLLLCTALTCMLYDHDGDLESEPAEDFVAISNPASTDYAFGAGIAFDTTHNHYLAIWGQERILGRLFDTDAVHLGSDDIVFDSDTNADRPRLAFNPKAGQFLSLWSDVAGTMTGAVINGADGAVLHSIETEIDFYDDQRDIAFNSNSDQYVVVWGGPGLSSSGRLLEADGSLVDTAVDVIAGPPTGDTHWPDVVYEDATDRYFVAWSDSRNIGATNYDIWVRYLASDLSSADTDFEVIATASEDMKPATVYNSLCGNSFLVGRQRQNSDIEVHVHGPCRPRLDFVDTHPGGVTPQSGAVGTEYTFRVAYAHADNTPPSQVELLIDFDGDGSYAAGTVARNYSGGASVNGAVPLNVIGIALLFFLASGIALFGFRSRRAALASGAVAVLFTVSLVYLPACGDDGDEEGDAGGDTDSDSDTDTDASVCEGESGDEERFAMTLVDTGATTDAGLPDYTDGQIYEVTLTLCAELPLGYTFRAVDGNSDAHGEATRTLSLGD